MLLTQSGCRGNGFIHVSMKEGCLFALFYFVLFVLVRSTESGCFRLCSWCPLKALQKEWVHGLGFPDVLTCHAKVLEYGMSSSLKMELNCSWKFWRNWNVPLVLSKRSWWAGFNGIYLVKFGFKMWEILIFKVIFVAENSNKFQKTRFWKEKSIEDLVKLEGSQVNSGWFPFIMGSHLGQQHRPDLSIYEGR